MLRTLHSTPDLRRSDMAHSGASAAAAPLDPNSILARLTEAPQSFQLQELPTLVDALYSLPEQLLAERAKVAEKINEALERFLPQFNLQQPRDDHQSIAQLKFLQLCLVNDHADPVPYAPQPVPGSLATPHLNGHHSRRASERDKPLNQELVELFLCSLYKYPEVKIEIMKGDPKVIMEATIDITSKMINNKIMLSQVITILGIINWQFYFTIYGNNAEQVYKFKIKYCLENLSKYFPAQVYVRLMGNYKNLIFGCLNLSFYDLRNVKLNNTKLGINLKRGSNITGVDFSSADVTNVQWAGCYVKARNKLPIMTGTIGLYPNFLSDLNAKAIRPDLP